MPITQALSSKGNIKKFTNQDLPFSPQQPVLSSYYAVSTAGQTVINLTFSVDTINLADQFFLFVDGKKLRLGSSNDYVFSALNSDGTSSQVILTQSLPVNLNIQAYMLGLKKESEFGVDNRFVQLYGAQGSGFQGFVDQTSFINVATSTVGAPVAGTFYSSITGRAPMVDLSQNLRPQIGIDRIMTQSVYQLQNEFGPNGEPVWATPNDQFGQIRFVGDFVNVNDAYGQRVTSASNLTGQFIEITFYGTGLNLMHVIGFAYDLRASVDGGSEGSNIVPSSTSGITGNRSYSQNTIIPVTSGLSLGVHTVKIRNNSSNGVTVFGFEVLNESSLVRVTPGIGYIQGQKYTSSALQSFAYNASATGIRGGRVVVYQNADGTIGRSWQAVNASQANLASADHTNEEIVRRYHFREFGAARGDDFSLLIATSRDAVFTLDDGTTSLVGSGVRVVNGETLNPTIPNSSFITFTFVGTGVDVIRKDDGNSGSNHSYSVTIDGVSIGSYTNAGSTNARVEKLVSGLPYGTHTLKLVNTASPVANVSFTGFIVYQPKKPSIPSNAIELADYNIMADFVNDTSSAVNTEGSISAGVLNKAPIREVMYVGTWALPAANVNSLNGFFPSTTTDGSYFEYTFFGTGIEHIGYMGGNGSVGSTMNVTYTIDGLALNAGSNIGSTASVHGFNLGSIVISAAGVLTGTSGIPATGYNSKVRISGLPLGVHKLRVVRNTITGGDLSVYVSGLRVITPIHSAESDLYADLQNTLPVGSQGISDNRKLTPVKETSSLAKAFFSTYGTATTTTTSTNFVPMAEMSGVINMSKAGRARITWSGWIAAGGGTVYLTAFVNGVQVGNNSYSSGGANGVNSGMPFTDVIPLSAGAHKIDIYWRITGGTATAYSDGFTNKHLVVEEI